MGYAKGFFDLDQEASGASVFPAQLGLANVGLSVYVLNRGEGFDYLHNHREQEEVYLCMDGEAELVIAGDDAKHPSLQRVRIARGEAVKVAPQTLRAIGNPPSDRADRVREAVNILSKRRVDFECDGEMGADVALNPQLMAAYPFARLSGAANVLVMPGLDAAAITTKMLQELGGSTVLGPILVGLDKPVQIVPLGARDADIVNMAAIASFGVN